MAEGYTQKIPDIVQYNIVRTMLQTYTGKRSILWFYDSYVDENNFHAFRLDINGVSKTIKYEEVEGGVNPVTLFTITGS